MKAVFMLLLLQWLLGAFDTFWHHETVARLPQRASARRELVLHSTREAIYAVLFVAFAWVQWSGWSVLLPTALLLLEVALTCADFLEEDRSRTLPPTERVLHTLLAVTYGVLLGWLTPVFMAWGALPGGPELVSYGALSWLFTVCGAGLAAWSLRDALAARALLSRQPQPTQARAPSGPAVLVTGGTGFIGSALVAQLAGEGRRVIVYTRDLVQARRSFGASVWVVDRLQDIPAETRIDAVVHLAGATVLGAPWTRRRRELLLASRTGVMRDLLDLLRRLQQPPRVLVAASAVGYYGLPAEGQWVDETAPAQPGRFQSDLCIAAEHEARRAEALGVRVVRMRFGIVLGRGGGAWPALALPARLGLGARLGAGTQPVPWIHLDDAVGLLRLALASEKLTGAVNAVAPAVPSQAVFAATMASAFGRRVLLRVPAWPLRLALGEMSELLLCGQRALPAAARAAGYQFRFPIFDQAARELAGPRRVSLGAAGAKPWDA